MKQPAALTNGGSIIADMRNFTVYDDIAAALVEVPPGRMREIHWHPVSNEWQYYIAGEARMTVFGAQSNARTFDYRAGHVGYVPKGMPHYVENTGGALPRAVQVRPLHGRLAQAVDGEHARHELVEAHLNIDRDLVDRLSKDKEPIA